MSKNVQIVNRDPGQIPSASSVTPRDPAILIDRDTAIAIYNYQTGETRKRMDPAVQTWFREAAKALGWAVVAFPIEHSTRSNRAGVVLISIPV